MKQNADIIVTMTGWFLVLVSLSTIVGNHFGVEWVYKWNRNEGMAINTAICFFVTGVGLLILGWYLNNERKNKL